MYMAILLMQHRRDRWPSSIPDDHVGLLLEVEPVQRKIDLLQTYSSRPRSHSTEGTLRFVDAFTSVGDYDHSLAAMRLLPTYVLNDPPDSVLQRCTNLLKLDFVEHLEKEQNFKILPQLLEMGLRPNTINQNVAIKSALKAGMHTVAWDIYRFMLESTTQPDSYTLLSLMQDALARLDFTALEELFTAIMAQEELRTNPYLIIYTINVLRRLHNLNKSSSPAITFQKMLAVYSRAWSMAPLLRLGMISDAETLSQSSDLPNPDSRQLAFVIWSWELIQHDREVVMKSLLRLRNLTGEGDLYRDTYRHDLVWNALLIFDSRSKENLPKCSDTILQMMTSMHTMPTVRTWGIWLLGNLRHGNLRDAEMICNILKKTFVTLDDRTMALCEQYVSDDVSARDALAQIRPLSVARSAVSQEEEDLAVDELMSFFDTSSSESRHNRSQSEFMAMSEAASQVLDLCGRDSMHEKVGARNAMQANANEDKEDAIEQVCTAL